MEDYLAGEGPRVTVNRVKLPVTSTTTPAPTTTTTTIRPKLDHPVVSSDNNYSGGIQWLHLKSPSDLHSPKIHQKSAIAKFQPPQVVIETIQPIVSISIHHCSRYVPTSFRCVCHPLHSCRAVHFGR
jgi:hypothetical protein